jgi:general secretion pathway protein K
MGMTPALFARIRPALTVCTKKPAFDPNTAPREALAALTPDDPQAVDEAIAKRSGTDKPLAGLWDPTNSLSGRIFTIVIDATKFGRHYSRSAVVLLTGDPRRPYLVLAWR